MSIVDLELTGFRGFASQVTFDFDADAVIIIGANGQGKTSIFDGVLWALTGDISRLPDKGTPISEYSVTGEARVSIKLRDDEDVAINVVRHFDGERQRIQVQIGEDTEVIEGQEANTRLLERIWPEALFSSDPGKALSLAITRSIYLQQDRVRDFIESTSEADRFEAVSELIGIGRITDLQRRLDTARSNWTRASTPRNEMLKQAEARVERLNGMLSDANRPGSSQEESNVDWLRWWDENRHLGVTIT